MALRSTYIIKKVLSDTREIYFSAKLGNKNEQYEIIKHHMRKNNYDCASTRNIASHISEFLDHP